MILWNQRFQLDSIVLFLDLKIKKFLSKNLWNDVTNFPSE